MRLVRYIKRKLSRYERWRRAARVAQRTGRWARAAEALDHAQRLRPSAALTVQLGHALKESGQGPAAVAAYRRAAAALPDDLDVREHLAAALRNAGQPVAAAEVFADMLRIDPRCYPAQRALAELGQRRLLPATAMTRELLGERSDRLAIAVAQMQNARSAWLVTAAFSPAHWGLFRLTYPTPPPPQATVGDAGFTLILLCEGADAADVRATLDSVADRSGTCRDIVLLLEPGTTAGERIAALPCAGVISECHDWRAVSLRLNSAAAVVIAKAGAALDAQAIAWMNFTARRNTADVVFGDHDFRVDSVPDGGWLMAPCLFGACDAATVTDMPRLPILIWATPRLVETVAAALDRAGAVDDMFRILLGAGRATHVARVLATFQCRSQPSLAVMNDASRPPSGPAVTKPDQTAAAAPGSYGSGATIDVVIPTRDQPALLERCVASLRQTTTHPDRVRLIVIDNRSEQAETQILLRRLAQQGVKVVADAHPFNWSAINNRAAAGSDADILVFANNDVEALTDGWDDVVESSLANSQVGAVGARLLYPDRSYQHAGVTFGIDEAALSAHEGVGASELEAGPGDRWRVRRPVAAVTGAFLATRRTTFEAVGGFDERLVVAYNDLDFCFRLRAAGLRIVYEPALTLLHHESKTRGHNTAAAKVEWDLREQAIFVEMWGGATRWDPGYNPQWALGGKPFDGYREPPVADVLRHIDCQAGGNPWVIAPMHAPG